MSEVIATPPATPLWRLSVALRLTEVKMASAQIDIPQDILDSARLTPEQVKQELALSLYAQRRLSVGKARELAGMSLWQFRQLLALHAIPVHYDEAELIEDMETLDEWDRSK
jgi:predicted HTH domain antitoxin